MKIITIVVGLALSQYIMLVSGAFWTEKAQNPAWFPYKQGTGSIQLMDLPIPTATPGFMVSPSDPMAGVQGYWPTFYAIAVFANNKYYVGCGQGPNIALGSPAGFYWPSNSYGQGASYNRQSMMAIYDPAADTWDCSKWDQTGPVPFNYNMGAGGTAWAVIGDGTQIGAAQAFAYDYDTDGTEEIYMHGGYPQWDGWNFIFDPDLNGGKGSWSTTAAAGNFSSGYKCQRRGGCVLVGSNVYVIGGSFWGPPGQCNLQVFSPAANAWTVYENVYGTNIQQFGIGAVGTKVYLLGGRELVGNPTEVDVLRYSPNVYMLDTTNIAAGLTKVGTLQVGVEQPSVVQWRGLLYVIAGMTSGTDLNLTSGATNLFQIFNPATGGTTLNDTPLPVNAYGASCAVSTGGFLYVGGALRYVDANGTNYNSSRLWTLQLVSGAPVMDITNAPVTVTYAVTSYAVAGTNNLNVVGGMWVSNALAGGAAISFSRSGLAFTAPSVGLQVGANAIVVYGTNVYGGIANDSVVITRTSTQIDLVRPIDNYLTNQFNIDFNVAYGDEFVYRYMATNSLPVFDIPQMFPDTNTITFCGTGTIYWTALGYDTSFNEYWATSTNRFTIQKTLVPDMHLVTPIAGTQLTNVFACKLLVDYGGATMEQQLSIDAGASWFAYDMDNPVVFNNIGTYQWTARGRTAAGWWYAPETNTLIVTTNYSGNRAIFLVEPADGRVTTNSALAFRVQTYGAALSFTQVSINHGAFVTVAFPTNIALLVGQHQWTARGGALPGPVYTYAPTTNVFWVVPEDYRPSVVCITSSASIVSYDDTNAVLAGTNTSEIVGGMWVQNASSGGAVISFNRSGLAFTTPPVAMSVGTNVMWVYGTNVYGVPAGDSITITRGGIGTGAPYVDITNENTTVSYDVTSAAVAGTNNEHVVGSIVWSNALTDASGSVPVSSLAFQVSSITLAVGTNIISVTGTNAWGELATDSVRIIRLQETVIRVLYLQTPAASFTTCVTRCNEFVTQASTNGDAETGYGLTPDGSNWTWSAASPAEMRGGRYTATNCLRFTQPGTYWFGARWAFGGVTNYTWNDQGQTNAFAMTAEYYALVLWRPTNIGTRWTFDTPGNITPEIGSGSLTWSDELTTNWLDAGAITFDGFSATDTARHVTFKASTFNLYTIGLTFVAQREATGPRDLLVQYTTNNGARWVFLDRAVLPESNVWYTNRFDAGDILDLNNNQYAGFRIVGTNAIGSVLEFDDMIISYAMPEGGLVLVVMAACSLAARRQRYAHKGNRLQSHQRGRLVSGIHI